MIFLSHNYKDKNIVRQIAEILSNTFGEDNVFYDEWSIQPGDSIIGKMSEGLEKCKFFFFFISKNSLSSKMVTLEWQTALRDNNKGIRFIPVVLDNDVNLPVIITNILHINLCNVGFDVAVRQIIDVINGDNTYKKELKKFNNLKAYVKPISPQHINIEIRAEYYMEPHSRYLIQIDNNENEVTWRLPDFSEYISGFNKQISFTNGVHNCILIEINGATSPNFPVVVDLIATNDNQLKFLSVFHATSRKNFESIPMNFNGTDLEKLNQVK